VPAWLPDVSLVDPELIVPVSLPLVVSDCANALPINALQAKTSANVNLRFNMVVPFILED
jgi:hypothetical protein